MFTWIQASNDTAGGGIRLAIEACGLIPVGMSRDLIHHCNR